MAIDAFPRALAKQVRSAVFEIQRCCDEEDKGLDFAKVASNEVLFTVAENYGQLPKARMEGRGRARPHTVRD